MLKQLQHFVQSVLSLCSFYAWVDLEGRGRVWELLQKPRVKGGRHKTTDEVGNV